MDGTDLSGRRRLRTEILLVAFVLVLVGPIVGLRDAQSGSREALTVSIWDHHTLRVDQERGLLTVDFAERNGHLYSDKAPLQPLLAVPFYAVYRLAGGAAPSPDKPKDDLALWWMTLWSSTIPAAALTVMMYRAVARRDPRYAAPAALAVTAGTLILPFSGMLFGHVLAGTFAFASWLLVTSRDRSRSQLFPAGLLAGAAVATEYPVAVLVLLISIVVITRERVRAWVFFAGGVVPALVLLWYQSAAFGSPFRPSYRSSRFVRHQRGLIGIYAPSGHVLIHSLFADRGLLIVTPIVLIGLISAIFLIKDPTTRTDGAMTVGLLAAFLTMQAGVDAYGGSSPGPRFVVPVLAFLAVPIAAALHKIPAFCGVATAIGLGVMLLAIDTNPYPRPTVNGIEVWMNQARNGLWTRTIFSLHASTPWPLLGMLTIAVLVAALVISDAGRPEVIPSRPGDGL